MLWNRYKRVCTSPTRIALLVVISFFTFQSLAIANGKLDAAEKFRDLGYAEQKKGNLPQALGFYVKAVTLGLESPVVLNDIAVIYEQIGLTSKAESFYLQAISLDEDYLPAYMNLAYFYQASGQDELAFQYFKKRFERSAVNDPWGQKAKEEMLKVHPEFITWVVTHEAKRLDEELVIKAHEEFSNRVSRATAHFKRGEQYEQEGKYSRAMMEYEQALVLTPDNPKFMEAKKALKIHKAKEEFQRRSEHALRMIESGNTLSAKEEVRNMLATIPND
jgi:tetratricopeptide (TPR) repeat protein